MLFAVNLQLSVLTSISYAFCGAEAHRWRTSLDPEGTLGASPSAAGRGRLAAERRCHVIGPELNEFFYAELVRPDAAAQEPADAGAHMLTRMSASTSSSSLSLFVRPAEREVTP
jgi:hypothetical protein